MKITHDTYCEWNRGGDCDCGAREYNTNYQKANQALTLLRTGATITLTPDQCNQLLELIPPPR